MINKVYSPFKPISALITGLIFLLLSSVSHAQYSLQNSNNSIIEKMTAQYKGRSVSLSEIDKIVRDLSQSGLFQVVFAEKISSNKVVIRAQQASNIAKITILGNASYTRKEIIEKMKIKVGQKMSRLEIKQAIEKIKDLYEESGFYNFQVKYNRQSIKDGTHLVVSIEEKEYCVIEDIKFFSKSDALNKELYLHLKDYIKSNYKKYSNSTISKDIEAYLLEHRFLTAKISDIKSTFNKSKTKVKLYYSISNPTQFEFIFHGNKHFSHFDLIKESQIGGKFLYLSDSSTEIIENISNLYVEYGFPKAKIKFSEKLFTDSYKKVLVFEIDEGPRIKIGKINIIGKLSKNKSHYLSLFLEKLAEENHSVYFVQNNIKSAAKKMIIALQREGYLQAQLLSIDIDYTKNNYANINLQIDENILTYVRQVLFRGAKSYNNIELKEEVGVESNKPLIMKNIEDSFERLEGFYKENAYLEFKIKNKNASVIQYKPGQPYADIVYQIEEGPKIKVKNIVINGLQKTKKYIITRELDFKRGDELKLSRVTNSIDRLEKTGLFSKVNVKSLEQNTKKNDRTIVVELEERKPGVFSAGVGIFNQGLLGQRGYVGALYNNLGGKARGISGRLDATYRKGVNYPENRIAFSYYEPYLFKNRVRGRISLIREEELFNYVENSSDIIQRNDIRLSGEKEFSKHFRFTYNVWDFSNQTYFNVRDRNDTGTINVGSTGPVFEFDYRNDQFLPTKGAYTRIDIEFSDPLLGSSKGNPNQDQTTAAYLADPTPQNEIQFYKTSFSTTFYTPLSKNKRWVWANSIRGGYLKNISGESNSGVPTTKSFFLGGNSIRGFSLGTTETVPGMRELCAKNGLIDPVSNPDVETNSCEFQDIYVKDDSTYFLVKSELRFPISGNLGGMLFYDGGAVYLGDFDLEDPYRDSVGVGLRYDTAVGSFVMGLGYKLDRKQKSTFYDKEGEVALHLAIGTF